MKNCTDCKYAKWEVTKAGRLHPSGGGRCEYPWKMPRLPAAMEWFDGEPKPWGGYISRKQDHDEHCVYYSPK